MERKRTGSVAELNVANECFMQAVNHYHPRGPDGKIGLNLEMFEKTIFFILLDARLNYEEAKSDRPKLSEENLTKLFDAFTLLLQSKLKKLEAKKLLEEVVGPEIHDSGASTTAPQGDNDLSTSGTT